MKLFVAFASCALLLSIGAVSAQSTSTTTTTTGGGTSTSVTTSSGTLHEYTPGSSFVIKETSGPVSYKYGKKVVYVTKSGKTLTDEDVKTRIKVGTPVRVSYDVDGDVRMINRVEIDD
jgi:hypothetical protein